MISDYVINTGMSEKEKQMVQKLKDLVEKQRDAIRAKDHELTLRSEDVEAVSVLQQTQNNTHLTAMFKTYNKFPPNAAPDAAASAD